PPMDRAEGGGSGWTRGGGGGRPRRCPSGVAGLARREAARGRSERAGGAGALARVAETLPLRRAGALAGDRGDRGRGAAGRRLGLVAPAAVAGAAAPARRGRAGARSGDPSRRSRPDRGSRAAARAGGGACRGAPRPLSDRPTLGRVGPT